MPCLPYLIQYIYGKSIKFLIAKMCMKFKFISIGTYLSGFTLCVVVMLTTSDPISLGTILYLKCFRYIWEALGAWLIHEGGGTMRKLEPSLDISFDLQLHTNAISVTSIYFMHIYIEMRSALCRLHHGMNFLSRSCDTCFLSQSIPTMISFC